MTGDAYAVGSFEEFWPYYVRLHQKPQTHWLHAAATGSTALLLGCAVLRRQPLFLLAAPLVNYLIAQTSHRVFERNQSTPWKNHGWHARAELRMLRLVVSGRMRAEVARHADLAAPGGPR
jgi:hypothetical protein